MSTDPAGGGSRSESGSGTTGPVRGSMVVPVFNTGVHIEQLIDSFAAQTLPQENFEVIFVDDGSTDETPARLDRLADERANVRVLHEPNSGWPGRPRNVGTDAARGEYVFFADHDDWLGPEALERMVAYADENGSDVLIGRYAGHHRGVARSIFLQNWPDATLEETPLMDSLTPHKMFRRAFLVEHGLRFPEGRRRLEDQVFVTEAYFLSARTSVLSDYHCYFHVRREDSMNAGYQPIDPAGYFGNVREVVALVLKYTEPGELRDKLLRRTVRTELLGRADGRSFLDHPIDYAHQLFDESRGVAVDMVPDTVDALLPAPQRVRALLLRENRFADLTRLVRHDLPIKAAARLTDLAWDDEGRLILDCEGSLVSETDGEPWRYRRHGDAWMITTPEFVGGPVPEESIDCTDLVDSAAVQIILRRRNDSEQWPVPSESSFEVLETEDGPQLKHRGHTAIDLGTVGGGRPLTPGVWDVYLRVSQTGWSREVRIGADRSAEATAGRRPAILAGEVVAPYWTFPHENLSLDVGRRVGWLREHVSPVPGGIMLHRPAAAAGRESGSVGSLDGTELEVSVPIFILPGEEPAVAVRLTSPQHSVDALGRADRGPTGELRLHVTLPDLDPGSWRAVFRLSTTHWRRTWPIVARLSVAADGQVEVVAAAPVSVPAQIAPEEPAPAR